jgi:hypothetical protein
MYQKYGDRAAFLFVYVREAHPSDGWQMPVNEEESVVFEQPASFQRRAEIATKCCDSLKLTMPCVVDNMENEVDALYAGWPERIFIIDAAGRIAYAGGPGPFGFKPKEAEAWLKRNL